jgi:hypothetical protein
MSAPIRRSYDISAENRTLYTELLQTQRRIIGIAGLMFAAILVWGLLATPVYSQLVTGRWTSSSVLAAAVGFGGGAALLIFCVWAALRLFSPGPIRLDLSDEGAAFLYQGGRVSSFPWSKEFQSLRILLLPRIDASTPSRNGLDVQIVGSFEHRVAISQEALEGVLKFAYLNGFREHRTEHSIIASRYSYSEITFSRRE